MQGRPNRLAGSMVMMVGVVVDRWHIRRGRHAAALPGGGEGQAGFDVFPGQIREVIQDIFLGHTGGELPQDIPHGHREVADEVLSVALAGFDGDNAGVVYRDVVGHRWHPPAARWFHFSIAMPGKSARRISLEGASDAGTAP